jgi:integrase
VRWRDGVRQRGRIFERKRDAEAFESEIKRRQRLGALHSIDAGSETLADFVEEWWRLHAMPNLAESTRTTYSHIWDHHMLKQLGGYRLRELTPAVVQDLRVALAARGVGEPTILKALTVLQSVMRLAVIQGHIQVNPVLPVKKPSQRRAREVRPLSPDVVEAIRGRLRQRDATLVSVLAYGGLRPGEALALTFGHVRARTLLVEGPEGITKTRDHRTVRLLGPLAQDLAEWRMGCGRPPDAAPIFPTRRGRFWADHDWRNWRRRIYQPVAKAVGASVRPYDLRHSFVSLLINEGVSIAEVARQAGHSPQTCWSTYTHVFDEFSPEHRFSAELEIRRARDRIRQPSLLPAENASSS